MNHFRSDVAASALVTVMACGPSFPEPAKGTHPPSAFTVVPYPPPAALAEVVPKRPKQRDAVWLDGDWEFRGKRYAWRRGGWYEPPAGAGYAPSRVVFEADGRIMFAPGVWYDRQGQRLEDVRPLAPAITPKNEYTSEVEAAR